jgi:L-alanine-DL-glutamate epimerase-like enolase superfamily enzyme
MATYDRIADLPLRIDDYALESLSRDVSSGFTRVSTVIRLRGGGHEGVGEDVSYDEDDQRALQRAGATRPLAGDWTLDTFSRHLATLDLWPEPARHEASVDYRVWAYESAALDLALRQAGRPLHDVLERTPRPLTFVVSYRLPGDPPTIDPLRRRLDDYPTLRFKLDPTSAWGDELIAQLAATGAVDSVDFKSFYKGTVVDQEPDPDLYARVIAAFPDAWIEDPALTPETSPVLAGHHDRITWDAPIHSVADIEALAFPPKMVNIKPSRFGALRNLFAAYDHCEAHGIGGYGGGQFELGPGRGHIQYLASVFHPDTPNDVAPTGYNATELEPGLPSSPLAPRPSAIGFRWDDA